MNDHEPLPMMTPAAADPYAGGLRAWAEGHSLMRESPDITKIAPALVRVQAGIANPPRNRAVQVRTKDGAYTIRYATLDKILDLLRGPLAENGLCLLQPIASNARGPVLLTRLLHESGQWMECEIALPPLGSNTQGFGSVVTYIRRYSVSAMLNIAADEDDDANRAAGNHYRDVPARGSQQRRQDPARGGQAQAGGGPDEIGEVVGEAVARVLVNRARLAESVGEGHALLDDWTRRMAVLEQLRGTKAWDALERELGAGLKRSLGTEPAAAFVAALRAATEDHILAIQQHWEGRWAETLAAMQAEAPATYALLRRHVAAQIARVRGGPAAPAPSSSPAAPGDPPSDPRPGDEPAHHGLQLLDHAGARLAGNLTPLQFARGYAEAWRQTEPELRREFARRNLQAFDAAAKHPEAREILNRAADQADRDQNPGGGA